MTEKTTIFYFGGRKAAIALYQFLEDGIELLATNDTRPRKKRDCLLIANLVNLRGNFRYLIEEQVGIMTLHQLIFSNRASHRVTRHLVFWMIYCAYFWIQSLAPRTFAEFSWGDTYYFAFLNLCSFGPVFISITYSFIYFVLPQTLQKRKYFLFILSSLMLYALGTFVNYFTAGIFLNSVHYSTPVTPTFQHRLEFANFNTRWGMIIATIALGIKLSKTWYVQQKENLEMLTKKTRAEMQLQRSRIHPELLVQSLDAIYTNIKTSSDGSASMILKLSDLLSYSLYESEAEWVPLERELRELQNLVSLERGARRISIETRVQIDRNFKPKLISPMIVVKLVEECLGLLRRSYISTDKVGLEIVVEDNNFSMTLITESDRGTLANWPLLIRNAESRLTEHYSKNEYWIDLANQEKEIGIKLNLKLKDKPNEMNTAFSSKLNAIVDDIS